MPGAARLTLSLLTNSCICQPSQSTCCRSSNKSMLPQQHCNRMLFPKAISFNDCPTDLSVWMQPHHHLGWSDSLKPKLRPKVCNVPCKGRPIHWWAGYLDWSMNYYELMSMLNWTTFHTQTTTQTSYSLICHSQALCTTKLNWIISLYMHIVSHKIRKYMVIFCPEPFGSPHWCKSRLQGMFTDAFL